MDPGEEMGGANGCLNSHVAKCHFGVVRHFCLTEIIFASQKWIFDRFWHIFRLFQIESRSGRSTTARSTPRVSGHCPNNSVSGIFAIFTGVKSSFIVRMRFFFANFCSKFKQIFIENCSKWL
jgi:hypothetical protein